jgi:hypothetical protein
LAEETPTLVSAASLRAVFISSLWCIVSTQNPQAVQELSMVMFIQLLILVCSISSGGYAMDRDQEEERKTYLSIIAKADANISTIKRLQQIDQNPVNEVKYTQGLFDAYMQKGAAHFHFGERDLQLRCYLDILGTKGLPKLTLARTQVNISVVHLQLNRNLLAASHLKKAEELASIEELGRLMGDQIYGIFAVIYEKTANELYLDHPKQSLEYQKRARQIPKQDELKYAKNH